MFRLFRVLKNRKKILGMNERNLGYIRRYNSSKSKRIADDKLRTKRFLERNSIPTPKLLGVIKDFDAFEKFDWNKLPESFVMKPVSGLEGGGIEIFYSRDKQGNWIKADGSRHTAESIKQKAAELIDGKYSLHNQPDKVFFEERIRPHKAFKYYTYKGVPDVRVIVFNSIPIMAMLRLPTKKSEGKANLQLGAIGAGIDMATGVTTNAIVGKSKKVFTIPERRLNISGLRIPFWDRILRYSVIATQAIDLKYAGIDFLIDIDKGPVIVEMNARPGLSIQLANADGLRWRLRKTRGLKVQSTEKGMRLAKDLFGGDIEEDIERISGKTLIGIYETINLFHKDNPNKTIVAKAKIDTGADSTSLDINLAKKLGLEDLITKFDELKAELGIPEEIESRKVGLEYVKKINEAFIEDEDFEGAFTDLVKSSHGLSVRLYSQIDLSIQDQRITTRINLYDRSKLQFNVIIGRKSLSRFLVEPTRKPIE